MDKTITSTIENLEQFIMIIEPLMTQPLWIQNTISLNNIYTKIIQSLSETWWPTLKKSLWENQSDEDLQSKVREKMQQEITVTFEPTINPYWTHVPVCLVYDYHLSSRITAHQYWAISVLFWKEFFVPWVEKNPKWELDSHLDTIIEKFGNFINSVRLSKNVL